MPQHTHTTIRTCTDCAGFASAAIATGTRNTDGTRNTIAVPCRACSGTGTTPATARPTLTTTRV